jgi:hypothetical protein
VTGVPRGNRGSHGGHGHAGQGTRGTRAPGHAPARFEISEQTTLGTTYVRSLMRSQLRTALLGLGALALLVGTLPLLLLLPRVLTGDARSVPGPLVWGVLGVVVYPVMWLIARWYVHRAERNERDFRGLVEGR